MGNLRSKLPGGRAYLRGLYPVAAAALLPLLTLPATATITSASGYPLTDVGSASYTYFFMNAGGSQPIYLGADPALSLVSPLFGGAVRITWTPSSGTTGSFNVASVNNGAPEGSGSSYTWTTTGSALTSTSQLGVTLNTNKTVTISRIDTGETIATVPAVWAKYTGSNTYVKATGQATNAYAQANAIPLLLVSTTIDAGIHPVVDMRYTGSVLLPTIKVYRGDGISLLDSRTATLVSNTEAGKAVVTSGYSIPSTENGTKPVIEVIERNLLGAETANKQRGTVTMASANYPFRIGANVGLWSDAGQFTSFQDYFMAGNWNSKTTLDTLGYPTDSSAGTSLARTISNPPTSGTVMELSWTQTTATDATWRCDANGGSVTFGAVAASGGRRRFRYTPVFTDSDTSPHNHSMRITLQTFPAGDPPKDIHCYAVGADQSELMTPTRKAVSSVFDATRFMDYRNVNGNAVSFGGYKPVWADRSLVGGLTHGIDGLIIEDMVKYCNQTNSHLWLNLPWYWSDNYYLNILPLIDSLLNPGLQIYIEMGNENTNSTLAGGVTFNAIKSQYVGRTGNAYLGDSGGGVGQICNEIGVENQRVFELMRPTIANFNTRVVRVNACFTNTYEYATKKGAGFTAYDFVTATAPYITFPSSGITDQTPAGLKTLALSIMNNVIDGQAQMRDAAYADGKRFGGYEYGLEFFRGGVDVQAGAAFRRSQECYDVYVAYLNRLRVEFGDLWVHYKDFGSNQSIYNYNMKEYDNATTQRTLDAFIDVRALAN